ncbi:MAG TPA: efflux transporter outer membrane subunit [Stellaceae bacterium]|nr:efflux transporter outer membrane subunit [Stellaceae bacterium]
MATLSMLTLSMLLGGCTVGPDFAKPASPPVDRVTAGPTPAVTVASETTGGTAQHLGVGRDIPGDWWTLFRSPRIEALVTQALKANPDLAAAQATLLEAKETMRAEEGAFFPSISASASRTRQKASLAGTKYLSSSYDASASLSYTFDVFGGISRQVEELGAQADYQQYELEAAYLSLTANVVTAALTEASIQAQIDATQEIIRLYREELDVTQRRFALGGVSRADVLSQQANLASAVATLPPLQKQLEQERNQLAVYLGVTPSQFAGPTLDLAALQLPDDLPVSIPSQLVEQRPDIKAYEALLHSATAAVGVAISNMLPQVTLTASYGRDAANLGNLFSPGGVVWSLANTLTQPIFEGGTLLHKRRSAVAALQVAAAQYSSTVNSAFQNVANAIVALQRDAETLRADLDYEQTALASLQVSRAQYQAGSVTYVSVLQAEQTYQNARLSLVSAQAARFTDTVALYQALGGGWWNRTDVDQTVATCCGILK